MAESTNEEAEMRDEKLRYDAKRVVMARQEVVEEEDKDGARARVRVSRMRRRTSPSMGLCCWQRRKVSVRRSRPVSSRPPFHPLGYVYIVVPKSFIIAKTKNIYCLTRTRAN